MPAPLLPGMTPMPFPSQPANTPLPLPSPVAGYGTGLLDPYSSLTPQAPMPTAASGPSFTLEESCNLFAADLFARLAIERKGNLFVSSGGVEIALAMAYAGSSGETTRQMARAMHVTLSPDLLGPAAADLLGKLKGPLFTDGNQSAYQLELSNGLWGQKGYGFKPDFVQFLQKTYGVGLCEVDFVRSESALRTINEAVAQQAGDKESNLLPAGAINEMTSLVLTSVDHFKSRWLAAFPKEATQDGAFKLVAGKPVTAPMMHLTRTLGYREKDQFQILDLPYDRSQLSMVLFLPKAIGGLAEVERNLSAGNLAKWVQELKPTRVDLTLPAFRLSSEFSLEFTLRRMGMPDAFDPARANFSGMISQEKLSLGRAAHRAYLTVNEEGTQAPPAAAEDAEGAKQAASAPKPVAFRADHPFAFVIRHNPTGVILFMGRLANPAAD
jgi:serpin B